MSKIIFVENHSNFCDERNIYNHFFISVIYRPKFIRVWSMPKVPNTIYIVDMYRATHISAGNQTPSFVRFWAKLVRKISLVASNAPFQHHYFADFEQNKDFKQGKLMFLFKIITHATVLGLNGTGFSFPNKIFLGLWLEFALFGRYWNIQMIIVQMHP